LPPARVAAPHSPRAERISEKVPVTPTAISVHQVEAERPSRPVFDEEAVDQQPCDDESIDGVEEDQALDHGSGDG